MLSPRLEDGVAAAAAGCGVSNDGEGGGRSSRAGDDARTADGVWYLSVAAAAVELAREPGVAGRMAIAARWGDAAVTGDACASVPAAAAASALNSLAGT